MAKQRLGSILPIAGLDTSIPAEFIKDVFASDTQNIEVSNGMISQRRGSSAVGGMLGEEVMAGVTFNSKGVDYVLRMGGTSVEYLSGTSWADVTFSGATLTADTTYPISFATPMLSGARIAVGSNLKDVPIKIIPQTMVAAILGGSPPKSKYIIDYGAYTILAHIEDTIPRGQRFQWSDTGDPENWTTGNSGAKDLIEGGNITGLKNYQNYFTIHKEDAIYVGYGVNTTAVFQTDRKSTPGTIANNSIQELSAIGMQAYLARDGIRLFNGSSSQLIPSPVNEKIKDEINGAQIDKTWSIVVPEKNEYWVGVATGTDTHPNTVYKYNYVTKAFYKDKRTNITCAFERPVAGQTFNDVMLGSSDQYTYKVDDSKNDGAVAISSYWDSKDFTASMDMYARWQRMDVEAKGDGVTIAYSTDEGVTWTDIATLTLGAAFPADSTPLHLWFDVVSSKIRFRFYNSTAGESFTLKQFVVYYFGREMTL